MSGARDYLQGRNRPKADQTLEERADDPEVEAIATSLELSGMEQGSFEPTPAQLFETWVTMGLIAVAPYMEEVFE